MRLSMRPSIRAAMLLLACAAPAMARPSAGSIYVAMGSSFAAGPGLPSPLAEGPARCTRSTGNYAHLLAARLHLRLIESSCSGATTAQVLAPWQDLPAQIDALSPDTALVTITIGGNDVGYFGMLWSASCAVAPLPPAAQAFSCPPFHQDTPEAWAKVEQGLREIALRVHRQAPKARLIFVDYSSALPASGGCASAPMAADKAQTIRRAARRLAHLTARVAAESGSEVLKVSALSARHSVCDPQPWMNGYPPADAPADFMPFHPNAKGMIAVADALEQRLRSARR